jgi:hypothetical protein
MMSAALKALAALPNDAFFCHFPPSATWARRYRRAILLGPPRPKYHLVVFISAALAVSAGFREDPLFPPGAFFPRNSDLNAIFADHIGDALKSLKQDPLWIVSKRDQSAQVYRLFWWPTRGPRLCVRIAKNRKSISLRVTSAEGPLPDGSFKPAVISEQTLTVKEWERATSAADKAGLWTAATAVKEDRGRADGDMILLEGVKEGKYHVTIRTGQSMGETTKALCRIMIELSKSDTLKLWDRWRERERKEPGYQREPTQTEDLGTNE